MILGGVALIKGRIPHASEAMVMISKEIDPFLKESGFIPNAPFDYINGIIRFGEKYSSAAEIPPIIKKYREQPFAVEVPMDEIRPMSLCDTRRAFDRVVILTLKQIAEKYRLPMDGLSKYEHHVSM